MEQMLSGHESENHLIQQASIRDKAAFTALYERCVDKVYRHVYYKVSNHADAEDLTQEVFVKAWKAIDKYKQTGAPFVAWLFTIASNLVIDHYRSRQKDVITNEIDENIPVDEDSDPGKQAEVNYNNALIKEAVMKLNGDKQRVIMMHFIDGFSYEEVAKILNKSEGAVRVIQYRALTDLRHLLKRD